MERKGIGFGPADGQVDDDRDGLAWQDDPVENQNIETLEQARRGAGSGLTGLYAMDRSLVTAEVLGHVCLRPIEFRAKRFDVDHDAIYA